MEHIPLLECRYGIAFIHLINFAQVLVDKRSSIQISSYSPESQLPI